MTAEGFDRELRYLTIMDFVKQMLDLSLITETEYSQIDERNRKKYGPVSGNLISGKFLLLSQIRANIGIQKEAGIYE